MGRRTTAGHNRTTAPNRRLWECKKCGRVFANRNQTHSCARYDLAHHFGGKPPEIRALFNAAQRAIKACGPVIVLPEKTRIGFQVRMTFAQLTPRTRWIDGHVVLARRLDSPRFRRIESFSPRNHCHHFRLERVADVDLEFRRWIREGYVVGEQKHLRSAEQETYSHANVNRSKGPAMARANKGGWKTCSRGHKYRGERCPICWKGNRSTRRPKRRR